MDASNHASEPWIVETSAEQFERDVLERSRTTPVVLDFWAAWCQPCLLLGPALEALAREQAGKFVLVKANMDDVPEAASQFQVQAIPSVFGIIDGSVVDQFQGVMPPEQLRVWLDRLLVAGDVLRARALEATDPAQAESLYRQLHAESPNSTEAAVGLARVLRAQDRHDELRQWIAELEQRGFLEPELQKIKASLELQAVSSVDRAALEAAVAAEPDNLERRVELARVLAAQESFQEALDMCLAVVQQDKTGAGERAREVMVDIFRVLPDDSPLTRDYRRRLATLLY